MSSQAFMPRMGQANVFFSGAIRTALIHPATSSPYTRLWLHSSTPLRKRARPGTVAARKHTSPKLSPSALPEGNIQVPETAISYTKAPLPDVIRDYDQGENKGYSVRYFEQDEHGVVRQLRDQNEFSNSWAGGSDDMVIKAQELVNRFSDRDVRYPTEGEVDDLAAELAEVKEAGAPPETIIQRLGHFVRGLTSPEKQRKSPHDEAIKDIIKAAETEPITRIDERYFSTTSKHKLLIQNLNQSLRKFSKPMRRGNVPPASTYTYAYKRYMDARIILAQHYDKIHKDVWDLLWKAFSIEHINNPQRLTMLSKLARDMSHAQVELPPDQQLVIIEVMFSEGYQDKAIQVWKKNVTTLGNKGKPTYQAFWDLGARMYCLSGDVTRAENIIMRMLKENPKADPRVLIDVIQGLLGLNTADSDARAWAAYQIIRQRLGDDMGLVDFDQVIFLYLQQNKIGDALNIFVDMMTNGSISVDVSHGIPKIVGNKFFMGKWLKRLIGNGELESALKVVRFMQKYNIPGAVIQLNGLIGAWQRSGSAKDLAKAESLGWEMIRSRLQLVVNRHNTGQQHLTEADLEHGLPLPAANLETFSLLFEDYQLRHLDQKLLKLWDTFDTTELPYNAFIMNQLMANSLDFGRVDEALHLYDALVTKNSMKPNSHTFIELWKALDVNRVMKLDEAERPNQVKAARQTFGEMIKHIKVFAGEEFNYQLGRKILHTFRRLEDRPGFIISLSMLRRYFNFMPLETLVLELVVGSTNLAFDSPHARHKVRLAKAKMENAMWEVRRKTNQEAGLENRLEDEVPTEERSELLFGYLRDHFLASARPEGREISEEVLNSVAADMGLFDLQNSEKIEKVSS